MFVEAFGSKDLDSLIECSLVRVQNSDTLDDPFVFASICRSSAAAGPDSLACLVFFFATLRLLHETALPASALFLGECH